MPKTPKTPKPPKPKPLFSRNEVIGLCKRFLREDEGLTKYYHPVESPVTMYQLLKRYPSESFWRALDLGFQLRSLYWFIGAAGKEELDRRWSIFNLDLGPQVEHTDLGTQKIGEDIVIVKPKTSIADLLR